MWAPRRDRRRPNSRRSAAKPLARSAVAGAALLSTHALGFGNGAVFVVVVAVQTVSMSAVQIIDVVVMRNALVAAVRPVLMFGDVVFGT